jgi:hypothetical protein
MTAKTGIARLKITLDDVKPPVVRRIEVPLGIRLDRLHAALQVVLGWTNSHLWEFRAGGSGWGVPDLDGGFGTEPHDAKKATLFGVLEDAGARSIGYLYDFGDGWEHTIKIERIVDAEPGALYPRLIDAVGRCPPEDIGGPWGYMEFLEAIADPKHERHTEMTEWHPADFDPNALDISHVEQQLAILAKRWSRTRAVTGRKST